MTTDRETAFQRHLDRSLNYVAAIHEAGDLAWFEVGHPRRAQVIERLGLTDEISELDLRRALFMRPLTGSAAA